MEKNSIEQNPHEYKTLCRYDNLLDILFPLFSQVQLNKVPDIQTGAFLPGKRVVFRPQSHTSDQAYCSLYLPKHYKKGKCYPIVAEYTGNKWAPCGSTGKVDDANLGYAVAEEIGAIWVVLPYVKDGNPIVKWWGDEVETTQYALDVIQELCKSYQGNHAEVFLCGFSRGAIGVNYLGLYNDTIADVWLGLFSHDHYDGLQEWKGSTWGSPLQKYRSEAAERFKRINGRFCLISQNSEDKSGHFVTQEYIDENHLSKFAQIQYNLIPITELLPSIPNDLIPHPHTDKWLLFPSSYRDNTVQWFRRVLKDKPGTYSIEGKVVDHNGKGIEGILVQSGATHFTHTNMHGRFVLNGLRGGKRTVQFLSKKGIQKERVIDLDGDCSLEVINKLAVWNIE